MEQNRRKVKKNTLLLLGNMFCNGIERSYTNHVIREMHETRMMNTAHTHMNTAHTHMHKHKNCPDTICGKVMKHINTQVQKKQAAMNRSPNRLPAAPRDRRRRTPHLAQKVGNRLVERGIGTHGHEGCVLPAKAIPLALR